MSAGPALLARLERPWTEEGLMAAVAALAEARGFTRFALMTVPSSDDAGAEMRMILSNWSEEFRRGFERLGFNRFTPVLRALRGGAVPFVWDAETLHGYDEGDPEMSPQAKFLGVNACLSGIYCPVHGLTSFNGVLVLSGPGAPVSDEEADDLHLAAFSIFGILAACRFEENRRNNPLTARERECLKLAMLGKTSSEIGTILTLSEHTISQYLTAATRKLDASNRTHAVALAAQLGYLS
ncbi:LuxR family transcriptional regulator [Aureimonas sp. AU12]|uniref:helix-turn-helix transcriptional regulator n=1 Tax=Aureimonas sp. AU12 TaxID=1638161 RepID=UPI0007843650|nr:LuxR family transcriptional regulator [Aureimonas sp. AU12]